MNEQEDYLINELDTETIQSQSNTGDYLENIDPNDEEIGLCWGIKVLDICIKKVSAEKVVLDLKLAGQRIARVTLTRKKACAKIKKSVGGDSARVDMKVCANFDKNEIRAKGKVCAFFICTKFNQRIFKW